MNMRIMTDQTLKSMMLSGGASCLMSIALGKGNPKHMTAIGALAALMFAVTSDVLRDLNLHPKSVPGPVENYLIASSLHIVGSLYLTDFLLQLIEGPSFSFAKTAIATVGLHVSLHLFSRSLKLAHYYTHIVIA